MKYPCLLAIAALVGLSPIPVSAQATGLVLERSQCVSPDARTRILCCVADNRLELLTKDALRACPDMRKVRISTRDDGRLEVSVPSGGSGPVDRPAQKPDVARPATPAPNPGKPIRKPTKAVQTPTIDKTPTRPSKPAAPTEVPKPGAPTIGGTPIGGGEAPGGGTGSGPETETPSTPVDPSGGDTGTPGGDPGTPGGDTGTPGGDTGNPGGDTGTKGGDTGTKGGDTGKKGGDTGTKGGDTGPRTRDTGSKLSAETGFSRDTGQSFEGDRVR